MRKTYKVKDDTDHETAAGADGNVLLIEQVVQSNLEFVATRTRIVVDLHGLIEGHVLDFDLVIDGNILVVRHCGDRFVFDLVVEVCCWWTVSAMK